MKSKRLSFGREKKCNIGLLTNGCFYYTPGLSVQYSKSVGMVKNKYYLSFDIEFLIFTAYISFNWSVKK
jgi:hypothetical protein